MNGFSKLRQLVADIQKSRPRAVRPADSCKLTWSDALDALRQANNEQSVSAWQVADIQKSRPRAVRPADSCKLTWSDALDALRQANNEPSVSPWQAKPAQRAELRRLTPKQALILKIARALFPEPKVLAKTKTAAIKRELDKNWKRFGGKGKPPDYKTIARALGRYI